MIKDKRLILKLFDIQIILLACLCICFLSPLVQRTVGINGILIVSFIYLLIGINQLVNCNEYTRKTIFMIFLYIGIVLFYSFIGKSDSGGGQTNNIIFLLSFFFIIPVYPFLKRGHCYFIISICTITILITLAQNYALFIRMGNRFTQQWYRIANIREVINTQYVSATIFFSGAMFSVFLFKKSNRIRLLYLGIALSCFVFNILVTQRAIALLLFIIMFALLMLVRGEITRGKLIRYGVFIILIIISIVEYQPILSFIAEVFDSDRIRARVNSINALITSQSISETEAGSLTARIRLMGVSISTFFSSISNFLFGVGDKITYELVGNHSNFLDEFAKFGVFGGILNFHMLIRMIKISKGYTTIEKTNSLYKLLSVIFVIAIIRSFVGAIMAPSIGIVLFVIIPMIFLLMRTDPNNMINEEVSN